MTPITGAAAYLLAASLTLALFEWSQTVAGRRLQHPVFLAFIWPITLPIFLLGAVFGRSGR